MTLFPIQRSGRRRHTTTLATLLLASAALLAGCAASLPYHGFQDQATLDQKDQIVIKESSGGSLDPMNLAIEDQQYEHHRIAYNRVEEGYYQWGARLYAMGYRITPLSRPTKGYDSFTFAFDLELDGGRHETRWAWLIAVGNASTYGGGMRIAWCGSRGPSASPTNGGGPGPTAGRCRPTSCRRCATTTASRTMTAAASGCSATVR